MTCEKALVYKSPNLNTNIVKFCWKRIVMIEFLKIIS